MGRRRLPAEPFEVRIDDLDGDGRGRTRHADRPLAVWDALPGETVRARYLFGRRFKGQAETLDVLEASADRVEPPCPSFGTCSACALQHLEAGAQLELKQARLLAALSHTGDVVPRRVLPPLDGGRWAYRRKARLSVRDVKGKGRVLVGFRERDGRFVTDMRVCHTLHPGVARQLPAFSDLVGSLDARTTIPQIEAACGDIRAAVVFRHLEELSAGDRERLRRFEQERDLRVYLQPKGPDTVHPLTPGPSELSYELPEEDLEFRFEPLDFIQVNGDLNRRMITQAMDLLAPGPDDRVLDLFCGLGNFTLPLARRSGSVLGLEGNAGLVTRAADNARRNGVANARFREADLYGAPGESSWPEGAFDLALLDPPRSGAGPVLDALAATGARRVLYVSCNPRTLAEDAGALVRQHGYVLAAAGAMDMFPQTTHIEGMALFERPDGA